MKSKVYSFKASSKEIEDNDSLFKGVRIRWQALTQSEKIVCSGIVLIPLWWVVGWGIMLFPFVCGVAFYEIKNHQIIRLSVPSLEVIFILLFTINNTIAYILNSPEIVPRALISPFLMWGCGGLLLWYIQSHKIRVRFEVVAWACSVIVCVMLLWWLFCRFVISEPYFIPPRTLYGIVTDKGAFNPNKLGGVGNFLVPYYYGERGFGGLLRYNFFFTHPTVTSFAISFIVLVALDIKNRLWSLPIVTICSFLIIIAQARNAWLSLPAVVIVRWVFTTGKAKGLAFILMLLAVISFTTLSVPSITDWVYQTQNDTIEATSNLRKESTETRNLIYMRTWDNIVKEPSIIGHGINGPSVQPGFDFAALGTESFILGTLLYKSGLLGTAFFLIFFLSFLTWFYNTRKDRPPCSFFILLYFALTSAVTEFEIPVIFITLIASMLRLVTQQSKMKVKKVFKPALR